MEDDRVAILEAQLAQAKLIAEEADKKYEEVNVNTVASLASFSYGTVNLQSFYIKQSSVICKLFLY